MSIVLQHRRTARGATFPPFQIFGVAVGLGIWDMSAEGTCRLRPLLQRGFAFIEHVPRQDLQRPCQRPGRRRAWHGRPHRTGTDLFLPAVMKRFPLLPLKGEGRLNDPRLRESLIELVCAYYR